MQYKPSFRNLNLSAMSVMEHNAKGREKRVLVRGNHNKGLASKSSLLSGYQRKYSETSETPAGKMTELIRGVRFLSSLTLSSKSYVQSCNWFLKKSLSKINEFKFIVSTLPLHRDCQICCTHSKSWDGLLWESFDISSQLTKVCHEWNGQIDWYGFAWSLLSGWNVLILLATLTLICVCSGKHLCPQVVMEFSYVQSAKKGRNTWVYGPLPLWHP